jgi:tetratricopeptide (TPR) repeat protein
VTHERHARHVARQLAPFADWLRADQRAALIKVGQLRDELIAAWHWALGHGDVDFVTQVASPWANWCEHKGRWDEGIALLAQAEASFDDQDRRELAALAAAARGRALLLHRKADAEASQTVARQAIAWSREIDHRAGIEEALNTLALILRARGRFTEALEAAREALAMAQADGHVAGETVYAGTVAFLELMHGRYDETERLWRRVLALHQRSGHWSGAVGMFNNLGNLLCRAQRWDEALPLLEEGLRLCDKHGFTAMRPFLLATLAGLHFGAGRHDAAREFAEIALADARRSGVRQIEIVSLLKLADLAMVASDLAGGAHHLANALAMAATGNDVTNQLGALDAYGRWLELIGDVAGACRAWHTVLAQPQLHAELRDSVTRRLQGHGAALTVADSAQQRGGMVLLTEQALRRLRQAASVAA